MSFSCLLSKLGCYRTIYTRVISAYFSSFVKSTVSILSLKIGDKYWESISLFNFNILTGTSSCGAAFLVLKFLISFAITFLSIGTKENSVGFLKHCLIFKMLGYLLYFLYCAITDHFHLSYHGRCSYLFHHLMCSQSYQKAS